MTAEPCPDMHLLVQADLDGELDAAGAVTLATHIEGCPACATLQTELGTLSTQLRDGLTRHAAPPALRAAILAQRPAALASTRHRRPSWGHGAAFGAGMAVAAAIATFIVLPDKGGVVPDIVAAHIRALQPGHLVDVASTDQHTVKPWFDGRLDYAPPVRDFAAQGFPLVGGRLDYLANRPIAALVYRRDKHLIDVFVWPGGRAAADSTVQGYNVVGWTQDGMNFRAVSDLNATEFADFVGLMRAPEK
jgi:anti-sigma factor RsiW